MAQITIPERKYELTRAGGKMQFMFTLEKTRSKIEKEKEIMGRVVTGEDEGRVVNLQSVGSASHVKIYWNYQYSNLNILFGAVFLFLPDIL
ncbi:hypothetical protein L2E82_31837 [Cichorium intybus]|uniref:Uncharacterized protein n=1 Tax=Cichorium intybus TaxID=13427 RepID=A0ACB9BGC4_CICIN|nr:hypothetical protein L2E82_31837 [Cichorium intybus]